MDVKVDATLEHEIRQLMLCCARTEALTYYAGDHALTASVNWTGEDLPLLAGKQAIARK